ncbi:unnamed protein product [Dracunculus medinensis]|uniref:Helitron_like_N domain-containing protein n=1 Tax=Dracunculus medinensis TaxID=318479 RepID=A0A0N4UGS0_DRAME|nr:unnamed protein product [Dracunculus medinensis]
MFRFSVKENGLKLYDGLVRIARLINQNLSHKALASKVTKKFVRVSDVKLKTKNNIPEVFTEIICQNCCTLMDQTQSATLRQVLSIIYKKRICPQVYNIFCLTGPICLPVKPKCKGEYTKIWPDVSDYEVESLLDAVDDLRIGSFRYHSLVNYHYELLLSQPLSYLSQFTGLGLVIQRTASEVD